MGQKNGFHAFIYNSAESEPIWMKFGTLWAKYWRLALADFGRDPLSSDSLRRSRNFVVFCPANNARFQRFPVGKNYDISTQQRQSLSPCKLSEQNFEDFTMRGPCSKKTQKLLTKFPGLATSGRYNSAIITNAENSRPSGPPTGCLVSIFKVWINTKSLTWAAHQKIIILIIV